MLLLPRKSDKANVSAIWQGKIMKEQLLQAFPGANGSQESENLPSLFTQCKVHGINWEWFAQEDSKTTREESCQWHSLGILRLSKSMAADRHSQTKEEHSHWYPLGTLF